MKMVCEYCGTEWNTTGDIHGDTACKETLKNQLKEALNKGKRKDQTKEIDNLKKELYHATAEWQEEKKRAREAEIERDENMNVVKVWRRRLDTVEEEFLIPLYNAVVFYRTTGLRQDAADYLDTIQSKVK